MSLSRSRKTNSRVPRVEINVVPLIDVFLVLLVIVLLTASFQHNTGVHVRLPASAMTQAPHDAQRDLMVGITAKGYFLWKGKTVTDAQLAAGLRRYAAKYGTEDRVTILGDERAMHGRVVRAMTLAAQANFTRLWVATRRQEVQKHVAPQ